MAAKTRDADIIVAAAGVPELITGEMIAEGAIVIDVGVNRIDADSEKGYELVGDVEFESATENADVNTPVPGRYRLHDCCGAFYNTVKATGLQEEIAVELSTL